MFALLAAAAIAAQATPAPPTPLRGNVSVEIEYAPPAPTVRGEGDDIVVAARRIYKGRAITRIDRRTGTRSCIIRRSFGVAPLDAALCRHLLACVAVNTTRPAVRDCLMPPFIRDLRAHYGVPPTAL